MLCSPQTMMKTFADIFLIPTRLVTHSQELGTHFLFLSTYLPYPRLTRSQWSSGGVQCSWECFQIIFCPNPLHDYWTHSNLSKDCTELPALAFQSKDTFSVQWALFILSALLNSYLFSNQHSHYLLQKVSLYPIKVNFDSIIYEHQSLICLIST